MDCGRCGAYLESPHLDGLFYEDEDVTCPECQTVNQIGVEEEKRRGRRHRLREPLDVQARGERRRPMRGVRRGGRRVNQRESGHGRGDEGEGVMRREFEMSEQDLAEILAACKPVPYMIVGGVPPESPQARSNRAWKALGAKLGFDGMTAQPVAGKGPRFFTAETAGVG